MMRTKRHGTEVYLLHRERRIERNAENGAIHFVPDGFLSLFIGAQDEPSLELSADEARQLAAELLRKADVIDSLQAGQQPTIDMDEARREVVLAAMREGRW